MGNVRSCDQLNGKEGGPGRSCSCPESKSRPTPQSLHWKFHFFNHCFNKHKIRNNTEESNLHQFASTFTSKWLSCPAWEIQPSGKLMLYIKKMVLGPL